MPFRNRAGIPEEEDPTAEANRQLQNGDKRSGSPFQQVVGSPQVKLQGSRAHVSSEERRTPSPCSVGWWLSVGLCPSSWSLYLQRSCASRPVRCICNVRAPPSAPYVVFATLVRRRPPRTLYSQRSCAAVRPVRCICNVRAGSRAELSTLKVKRTRVRPQSRGAAPT